jgi:hypothetical protein
MSDKATRTKNNKFKMMLNLLREICRLLFLYKTKTMLAVERKKTDKLDLGKPLQQYVRNQYSAQAAQDLEEAFNNVQQLREDMRNIQDKNDATRDLLYRFVGGIVF